MTDSYAPTTAYSPATPLTAANDDVYPTEPPRATQVQKHPGSAGTIHAEKPQRHPIAYLALALSLVALLWLAIWSSMSGNDSSGFQRVRVGTQDCVSVPQASGPAGLYCRTDTVTK